MDDLLASGRFRPSRPGSVETTLNLPDIVSLGIRQRFDPQWTVMGTVEWAQLESDRHGQRQSIERRPGADRYRRLVDVPFQYDDGWFFGGRRISME